MSTQNDGGPAFPISSSTGDPRDGVYCCNGMSLRDWFAGHETLREFDDPEVSIGNIAEELAGRPKPEGGWVKGNFIEMLKWEAEWRSALKFIRADAMLAAREKGIQ